MLLEEFWLVQPSHSSLPQLSPTRPKPSEFVEKAGASDTFEVDSTKLMSTSKNWAVAKFAREMLAAHTKSTTMVKTAARSDHLMLKVPS